MGAPVVALARRVRVLEEALEGVPIEVLAAREGVRARSVRRWIENAGLMVAWGKIVAMPVITTDTAPETLTTCEVLAEATRILTRAQHEPGTHTPGDHTMASRPGKRVSGHGRRLSVTDRAIIQIGITSGFSARRISQIIGCAPSTVTREIKAHTHHWRNHRVYSATVATATAVINRRRPKPRKLDTAGNAQLRAQVVALLADKHSPQEVTGRLKVLFPDNEAMRISHETIYQALYVQTKGGLRHELAVEKALRSGRRTRKPASKLPAASNRSWIGDARITHRPAEAEDRAVPGHWEGDLVVGPGNSGIITLVERSTRFVMLGKLPGVRDSATVTTVLQSMIQDLPAALTRSITWDQGPEMAAHARFTVATKVPVFMCDPHSPWQRGTNENTNGLLRVDYYPKGTNFNDISDEDLQATADQLNRRARATLGFHTPAEKLNEFLTRVALTP